MVYLDTSVLLSKLFAEPVQFDWKKLSKRKLFSCSLIYYEALAASVREGIERDEVESLLQTINIVHPRMLLKQEVARILALGMLKGADLMHLATAVWLSNSSPRNLYFLSFDKQQSSLAKKLGFRSF